MEKQSARPSSLTAIRITPKFDYCLPAPLSLSLAGPRTALRPGAGACLFLSLNYPHKLLDGA